MYVHYLDYIPPNENDKLGIQEMNYSVILTLC